MHAPLLAVLADIADISISRLRIFADGDEHGTLLIQERLYPGCAGDIFLNISAARSLAPYEKKADVNTSAFKLLAYSCRLAAQRLKTSADSSPDICMQFRRISGILFTLTSKFHAFQILPHMFQHPAGIIGQITVGVIVNDALHGSTSLIVVL